jgi:hypothetical protein
MRSCGDLATDIVQAKQCAPSHSHEVTDVDTCLDVVWDCDECGEVYYLSVPSRLLDEVRFACTGCNGHLS